MMAPFGGPKGAIQSKGQHHWSFSKPQNGLIRPDMQRN